MTKAQKKQRKLDNVKRQIRLLARDANVGTNWRETQTCRVLVKKYDAAIDKLAQ